MIAMVEVIDPPVVGGSCSIPSFNLLATDRFVGQWLTMIIRVEATFSLQARGRC